MKIICAGMRRSGSTWLYNTARLIHVTQAITKGEFSDQFRLTSRANIIKTHRFDASFMWGSDLVLTCHRDMRDVVASAVRRGLVKTDTIKCIEFALKSYNEYEAWKPFAALDVKYEEMIADPTTATAAVAKALGIEVDPKVILAQVQELPVAEKAVDPEILLHENHFTDGEPGSYVKTLSVEIIENIELVFKNWQTEHGYGG